MIHLVEPQPEPVAAARTIASIARTAIGADAVVMVESGEPGHRPLLYSSGLSPAEGQPVIDALDRAYPAGGSMSITGFARVFATEAVIPGVGGVILCALQRRRATFERARLAGVFARHGVIAAAVRRAEGGARFRGPLATGVGYELIEQPSNYAELDSAITQVVRRLLRAERAGVFMWSDDDEALRAVPGTLGSDPAVELPCHGACDWASSVTRVFVSGDPYLANRPFDDPGVRSDYVREFAMRRVLTVPIAVSGRRVGVLQVINKATDFTQQDLHVAEAIAPAVAAAVQATDLRHRLRQTRRLEQIFTSTAVAIASGRELHEYLDSTLESLCDAIGGSVIALVPAAADPVICRVGDPSRIAEPDFLAQARGAVSLRAYHVPSRGAGEPGWSAAHVPVVVDGDPAAVLSVLRAGGVRFEEDDCAVVARMAQLISLAWAGEAYQRGLADAARIAERQRIADELHDQVAQLLFAARLGLDFAMEVPDLPAPTEAGIGRARELLARADAATRRLMERNSILEEAGFADRLASLVGEIEEEFDRAVALEVTPAAQRAAECLSAHGRQLIARAAREALVNAAKHAGPCQLSVRLTITRRNRLLLTVTDAGIGLGARRADGYGTAALRRAVRRHGGILRVNACSAGGTRVAVSLPF
ncbi:MAG: GAF domain-containing sensor histidine kinase [Solirubrobacteraceae bacterium]